MHRPVGAFPVRAAGRPAGCDQLSGQGCSIRKSLGRFVSLPSVEQLQFSRQNHAVVSHIRRTLPSLGLQPFARNNEHSAKMTKAVTRIIKLQKYKGFSLIELLIVVAIILIIAAIAIPNLLRARIAANESSAVGSVRTVNSAEVAYSSAYPTVGFATSLTNLAGSCTGATVPTSSSACLIDAVLAGQSKSGYSFTLGNGGSTSTPQGVYEIDAKPITVNQTGVRYFCSSADAVVRYGSSAFSSNCQSTGTPLQ